MTEPSRQSAESPTVVVVGCGAVGLPVAVALADRGRQVLGYDIDGGKVCDLQAGRSTLAEPDLAEALKRGLAAGKLSFESELARQPEARVFVVAAPTPAAAETGCDMQALAAAVSAVDQAACDGDLVCIRSTVPIGATRALSLTYPRLAFAACPDRTLSGRAFAEQFSAPQIVGGVGEPAALAAEALFASLGQVVRVRDAETAEAIKLFANVQRDTAFALANQFALVCEAVGVSFAEVRAAGRQGYSRFDLARAGPVGGPCLTKDTHVLADSPDLAGCDLGLLSAARRVNEALAPRLAGQIMSLLDRSPGPVAILGLAFKGEPPTSDRRGAFAEALETALGRQAPTLEIRRWDPADAAELGPVVAGAAAVVLANDHAALGDVIPVVSRWAPDAEIFDVTGVLGDAGSRSLVIHRFGEGRRREGSRRAVAEPSAPGDPDDALQGA